MKIFVVFFLILSTLSAMSQNNSKAFLVMFYNVENLFDTIDDKQINDNDFLPGSQKNWNTEKYYAKLANLSKVILAVDSNMIPDVIGLSEIENKAVLKDLVRTLHYKKPVYSYIHEDGGDSRGIDVALLYNPNRFTVISSKTYPMNSMGEKEKSRDILYVQGRASSGDTVHIFVNHWKSRVGGSETTEIKRVFCAMTLKGKVDSLLQINPVANIIVMGDFNDDPENKSIFQILQANNKRKNRESFELFNLFYDVHNFFGAGTLFYDKSWYLFDQIMVSNNLLLNTKGLRVTPDAGSILNHEWMTYKIGQRPQPIPKPTYEGKEYLGGYSDHLPVFVKFFYP